MEFDDSILFSVFGLPVTAYALCLALAVGAGLFLFFRLGKKEKIRDDALWSTALWAIPLSLLGARVFYCLCRISMYLEIGPISILKLWEGGYALWGAVGGACLAGFIGAKRHGENIHRLLDVMAVPGALVIAACRFGECLIGQGYGPEMENEALWFFPLCVFRENYEEWNLAVFMLEGLYALILLGVLLSKRRPEGDRAKLFLILYSSGQILLESLRRDSYLRWLFVRVSQLTAALVIALVMGFALAKWIKNKENRRFTPGAWVGCWIAVLGLVGVCVAMEFSVDGKGKLLTDIPVPLAYLVMGLCCAALCFVSCRAVFHSVTDKQ